MKRLNPMALNTGYHKQSDHTLIAELTRLTAHLTHNGNIDIGLASSIVAIPDELADVIDNLRFSKRKVDGVKLPILPYTAEAIRILHRQYGLNKSIYLLGGCLVLDYVVHDGSCL